MWYSEHLFISFETRKVRIVFHFKKIYSFRLTCSSALVVVRETTCIGILVVVLDKHCRVWQGTDVLVFSFFPSLAPVLCFSTSSELSTRK